MPEVFVRNEFECSKKTCKWYLTNTLQQLRSTLNFVTSLLLIPSCMPSTTKGSLKRKTQILRITLTEYWKRKLLKQEQRSSRATLLKQSRSWLSAEQSF